MNTATTNKLRAQSSHTDTTELGSGVAKLRGLARGLYAEALKSAAALVSVRGETTESKLLLKREITSFWNIGFLMNTATTRKLRA
jgi:hypothetical protein